MEETNDADGPKSGRKAHKKKVFVIDDSGDDSVIGPESEITQSTSGRKSNLPPMEEVVTEANWEGSDDSSDDLLTENSDDSSDETSNDSNSERNSDWTTDSEEEEDGHDDVSRPSTSRACTRKSRQLIDSCSDGEVVSEDDFSPQSSTKSGEGNDEPTVVTGDAAVRQSSKKVRAEGESKPQDRDNFQGSSSETDDGDGPKTRCPICLRSLPGVLSGAEVGSPEGCQHLFCVCCIQEWAKNVNTCPVDRHEFSEIVVFEGVGGKEVRRLPLPKKPRGAPSGLEDEDITLISQIEEDPTFCEVCGSGDREDSLLLCDGCDRGYHLDCLTPPLTSVPIEEWFCSTCTSSDASRQRTTRANRNMRMLPRTSASQRVLRSLRRDAVVERGERGLRTWNIRSHDLELMEEMAELEVERRWAENSATGRPSTSRGPTNRRRVRRRKVYKRRTMTRKKRKMVTKKRLVKRGDDGEEEEEEEVEEEEVTTTSRRRRGKRRKGAGKKLRRGKKVLSKRKGRSRLAETLGIVPGKKGPLLRKKGICGHGGAGGAQGIGGGADGGTVINGAASGIGARVPTLSIFGSRNDLEYFSDGSDVEGGGGSLAVASIPRRIDSAHAHQLAKERLISSIGSAAERRKALIKERALASASPSTGAGAGGGVPDLLGSILESQSVWHGRKSKVKLNYDGSIVVEKSKTRSQSQDSGCGDSRAVGPKSIETTSINNEMNVNSGAARVPSNPAEPSTTAQDSCSTFRDGSSGVEVRDTGAGVETREAMDANVRPVWPVRTLDADLREQSSSAANRKDRLSSQNVNESHYASRAPSTMATQSVVTTSSRATNNFRSIEHLAGNVIVNSTNRNYVDASDDGHHGRPWDSLPSSSTVKSDRSVIASGFISHVNPNHESDAVSGGSFGPYGFSPNSPLDLSSSSQKGDARELLHRNMYLDLSSGGRGAVGFGPMGYGMGPYSGVSCEAVDMRVQASPSAPVVAEDLRVGPSVIHPHIRSHSVIKQNPSIEPISRSYGGSLHQDLHANIVEPPPMTPCERVDGSVVTPLEAVKTIGLPGSSGNGSSSHAVNSSVRDMGSGDRTSSSGGGETRGGTDQHVDYARANSGYGSEAGDTNGPGNGGGGGEGGGGGGDRNDRPQLLKRHLDEDEEEEEEDKEDREQGEDEDVDIYSDIEPGGSDPPMDTIAERHVHVIETPPDQGPMFHPSLQASGSDKYDPAEPSYDTDDEMVIDEEGGNVDEAHSPRSNLLEGEVPPPPPLPPSLMDSIAKLPEDVHGYDRERSVTPTEEDERRKAASVDDEGSGRPAVGVRVYGILSQGKFGLGVNAYGSDDEDEGDDDECPNFSIYSATSVNIARTAEAEEGPNKEVEEPESLSEKVDESLKVSSKSVSPTEEITSSEKEPSEEQWNDDQSVMVERPPSPPKFDDSPEMEKNIEDSCSEIDESLKKNFEKSVTEKSDVEEEPVQSKSDAEPEKSDGEAEIEKSSDVEGEKSDDGAKTLDSKSTEESLPNEREATLDDGPKELVRDEEEDEKEVEEKEPRADEDLEGGTETVEGEEEGLRTVEEGERTRDIVVPELEGLETETISEAEETAAFDDLEASKRRSCGGEEEEGEIVDDRAKCLAEMVDDGKDAERRGEEQEGRKVVDGVESKKEGKKEGRRRARKKADANKDADAAGGDAAIAWKKLSKLGKERNYREKGAEDPNQSKKELEDKEDKENRRGKKERDRRKAKRKDLERYDVRKVVGERSKTKRRRTDAFGRELRSNSRSRSRSRLFSRSRSRGIRSRSRGRSRSPRGRSRSRGARSRSRGARSRSRGRRSRSRGGRSRSRNSRSRLPSKSRGRSRSRGKGRRSRSRSRVRQRSRSRGARSRSRGGRSRSRQRSRDRIGRRSENTSSKAVTRKKSRRSRSPVSERRKQSRSRSRQRKRSRSRSRRRRTEPSQGSWERSWSRSWTRSMTPVESRSQEKTRGHIRSRSLSGSRIMRDRSPMPMSRSPSHSRGRSFCRSPSTPTLPPPPRSRMGVQSISRSPSRSPERMRSPAMASVGASKKKRKKKEARLRKEVEMGSKKRKKRRERSPAASKEVFASGDNILVSVSFKSAPKENSSMPKRRKALSPNEEKVKVMEEPPGDSGSKKKRKFMPVVKKKPSVIIDLETSPFVERVPSPADLIVLSDSSGENEDKAVKQQQQQMDADLQRRHRMMLMSPVQGPKTRTIGVKEKRVGGKVGKKGKLGGKGKKSLGKKERKVAVATSNAPSESVTLEEPPLPLSVTEDIPLERRLGPKTPPEPQVKFCITSKGSQLRSVNNPLREDDEDEEDEISASEAIAAAAQLELGQKVLVVQGESEVGAQDGGLNGEMGDSEVHQAVQVGPNTPPGPSTPDLERQFNEMGEGASPTAPQEEAAISASSRTAAEEEAANKDGSAPFEEPTSRKDQEMDTYDPFEPTNSPAPSPPAPDTDGLPNAEESRDVPSSGLADASSSLAPDEQRPVEEEVAVAEPKAEEPSKEPMVEEAKPTTIPGSVQGVANIARTLGTTVGAIDAVGGFVLPLLAHLGAVAQPQPLNAAVAAVTSANSPIIQQQQLSPLVNRAFPQQPQQAKAADVIRTLFGTGLRQFPEVMVASSGAAGAFSVTQPKVSKTDLTLGGGVRGKGGPRVAVTAPRVAVATPRVVVPTPRVAVTPRVATANGKDQPPGQDRVDVVDMDLESPYSPASSEGDDLFEPPSYESAGSARQASVLSQQQAQQQQQSKGGMKGSQRSGTAPSGDKFDNLFGSSPMRRNNSGGAKARSMKNHKGSAKSGKSRVKTGKVNVRTEEDHHLTILDELPNSAVEMQVKEKFLIKLNRQERVVEEVKLALKPHYNKKHLSKEEYKDILRRSVPKICHNRSGEINPVKIRSLVEAYVRKFRYARKKDSGAAVSGTTRANKGKKPT